MSEPKLVTKSLKDIFCSEMSLSIPEYQRAYEWKTYHVKNLLNDTYSVSLKNKPYLMGTIILHENEIDSQIKFDIIDGQQRLITLSILMHCLESNEKLPLIEAKFNNIKSFYYIKNTQNEINAFLKNKSDKDRYKEFLLKNIQFSVLTISGSNAIDQAYTFFDSGKVRERVYLISIY